MTGRTRRSGRAVGAVLLALSMAACGSAGTAGEEEASPERVTVVVRNHNWQDATIYVLTGGARHRLGNVGSLDTHRFRLPSRAVRAAGIRLGVDLIGSSGTEVTDRIPVRAGDRVEWTLENQLSLSSYAVRQGSGQGSGHRR